MTKIFLRWTVTRDLSTASDQKDDGPSKDDVENVQQSDPKLEENEVARLNDALSEMKVFGIYICNVFP